jgi:hypothetical protein
MSTIPFLLTLLSAGAVFFNSAFGQIKGKVTLARLPVPASPHAVTKNQSLCGVQIPNETLIVGKKLELQNAVVFLANIKPDSLPPVEAELRISKCAFRPHVLALLAGDRLVIENQDATLQHSRGYLHKFREGWDRLVTKDIFHDGGESVFNFAFPAKGTAEMETLREPGLLEIRSEIGYDWMKAYVLVMPHRFYALTDAKGEFELEKVPPGQFDLILWHETLGVKRRLVEVAPGKGTELLITWEIDSPEAAASDSSSRKD